MHTTTLGRTGLVVSVAGLGCGGRSKLGQSVGRSFQHSVGLVRDALDQGVTLVDTADRYGTEEIVGAAIRGRRDGVVVSTKVWILTGALHELDRYIDVGTFERRVDDCLRRLDTDVIDVLHLHGIAPAQYDYARDVLLPSMERMRAQGKIRFTGLSERFETDTTHQMAARAVAEAHFDVVMVGLNYVNQTALTDVLPVARANSIGTLCMYAVRGTLAHRASIEALIGRLVESGEIDAGIIDAGNPLGFLTEAGVASSLAEAAYRFCRHAPGVDVTITGTGSRAHLRQNLSAIGMRPLPDPVVDQLERIFGTVTSASGDP